MRPHEENHHSQTTRRILSQSDHLKQVITVSSLEEGHHSQATRRRQLQSDHKKKTTTVSPQDQAHQRRPSQSVHKTTRSGPPEKTITVKHLEGGHHSQTTRRRPPQSVHKIRSTREDHHSQSTGPQDQDHQRRPSQSNI